MSQILIKLLYHCTEINDKSYTYIYFNTYRKKKKKKKGKNLLTKT